MACILARIPAVTPQRGGKAGARLGVAAGRVGVRRGEEYERRAGSAPEKKFLQADS